jgi:hypothetical protein
MIGNNDVRDPDGYMKEYLPLVQATLKAHGAVYVLQEKVLPAAKGPGRHHSMG